MKTKKLFLSIAMLLFLVGTLCGCSLLTNATSIEISEMPKTTYEVGEVIGDFKITVYYSDNTSKVLDYTSSSSNGISVTNFDTSVAGTKTATIKYLSFVATFEYTVVSNETGFAGGNGTEESPYIIVNYVQLRNIKNDNDAYYKLGANIDLPNDSVVIENSYFPSEINNFQGVLDGANYTIKMNNDKKAACRSIFYEIKNATIKNLNIHMSGTSLTIAAYATESSLVNVDVYGELNYTTNNNNETAYIVYPDGNITLEKCDNYADIYGTNEYTAVYLGFKPSTLEGNFTLIDCNNYGDLYAGGVSLFMANGSTKAALKLNIQNSNNYGKIVHLGESTIYFAIAGENQLITITDDKKLSDYMVQPIQLTSEMYSAQFDKDKQLEIENTGSEELTFIVTAIYYGRNSSETLLFAMSDTKTIGANQIVKFDLYNYSVMDSEATHHTIIESDSNKYYAHNDALFKIGAGKTSKLAFTVYVYNAAGQLIGGGKI